MRGVSNLWSGGSEDMMETDDSGYEDPLDRINRLYVEDYNYNLFDGMTPMTYTPPPPPYGRADAGDMRFGRKRRRN